MIPPPKDYAVKHKNTITQVTTTMNMKQTERISPQASKPKISIITSVYNNHDSIGRAIESVLRQTYDNLEYIVVDGKSTDRTWETVQSFLNDSSFNHTITKAVSEKDNGLYDGLNKGIRMATGDYIGFVHADDCLYDDNVLADVAQKLQETDCDLLYGDGVFVDVKDHKSVVRNWRGGRYSKAAVRRAWLPLHPTVFIKREIYEKYGVYDTSLHIAGDTDLLFRMLLKYDLRVARLRRYIIRMTMGGVSTSVRKTGKKWEEDRLVLQRYGLPRYVLWFKIIRKIPQCIFQIGFYKYVLDRILRKVIKK